MLLNHLDLPVSDVPTVARFLVDHFAFVPVTRLDSPAIVILDDGHGFTFVLQRRKHAAEAFPAGLHIGFIVGDRCGGHWSVNGVELGDGTIGRIDDCGLYEAPAVFPDDLQTIEIVASESDLDQCADCCPYAAITLRPVR